MIRSEISGESGANKTMNETIPASIETPSQTAIKTISQGGGVSVFDALKGSLGPSMIRCTAIPQRRMEAAIIGKVTE